MHKVEIAQQAIDISLRRRGARTAVHDDRAAQDSAVCRGYANRVHRAGSGRGDSYRPRDCSKHQSPRQRAAAGRRDNCVDRLDLRARGGARLDDVLQFHHHRRGVRSISPCLPGGKAGTHVVARAEPEPGGSSGLEKSAHSIRRSKPRAGALAAVARRRHGARSRHRDERLLRMHGARCRHAQFQDDHDLRRNASRNDVEHNATLSIFLQAFGGVLSTDEAIELISNGKRS